MYQNLTQRQKVECGCQGLWGSGNVEFMDTVLIEENEILKVDGVGVFVQRRKRINAIETCTSNGLNGKCCAAYNHNKK